VFLDLALGVRGEYSLNIDKIFVTSITMNEVQQDILNDFLEQAKPATIWKRVGAAVIDGFILLIVFVVLGNVFGEVYRSTTTAADGVSTSTGITLSSLGTVIYLCGWFLVMPFMEGRGGQTFGKKIIRIKVTRSSGDPTNIGISFLRHFFDFVDCFFFIGLIVAASNPEHKRIADAIASTRVVDIV